MGNSMLQGSLNHEGRVVTDVEEKRNQKWFQRHCQSLVVFGGESELCPCQKKIGEGVEDN